MNAKSDFNFKKIYAEHISLRNESLHKLKLPFPSLRRGQKELLLAISDSLLQGETFVLNAPTGFGKTFVTLLPALAALAKNKIKRIYYFTNQESQRILPSALLYELDKLNQITLWTQTLYSSERCCPQHDFCYLNNNKKELKQTAEHILSVFNGHIDFIKLQKWAKEARLCPYLLQMELAKYSDLIILDYNYLFDPLKQLKSLKNCQEPLALLFDEAHNIPKRGQEIYQVKINLQNFLLYEHLLTNYLPIVDSANWSEAKRKLYEQLFASLQAIIKYVRGLTALCSRDVPLDTEKIASYLKQDSADIVITQMTDSCKLYVRHKLGNLSGLIVNFASLFIDFVREEQARLLSNYQELKKLQDKLNDLKRLRYILTNYSDSFVTAFSWQTIKQQLFASLAVYCLDAMPLMLEQIPEQAGSVFFSATLLPLDYYAQIFATQSDKVNVASAESPFPKENRQVAVLSYADLSYQNRNSKAKLLAKSLLAYLKIRQGHLLVFAPSYKYLQTLELALSDFMPDNYQLIVQKSASTLRDKKEFIARLQDINDDRPLLALAVMQSSFSEGLDLPGKSITAVAIISTAFPAKSNLLSLQQAYFRQRYVASNTEDNQILAADYYEQGRSISEQVKTRHQDPAYLFSQLYPSFSKIMQACGRLIRNESDKGEILLIDERFTREEYRPLLEAAFGEYTVLADLASYVEWLKAL